MVGCRQAQLDLEDSVEQHGDHVHDGAPVPDGARVALVDSLAE